MASVALIDSFSVSGNCWKLAVTFKSAVMVKVMVEAFESDIPEPLHPEKEFPAMALAVNVAWLPWR